MNLKEEISMHIDYSNTHFWKYFVTENFLWFSNLIYHKFLSENVWSIEKFITEVIWGENHWETLVREMIPRIMSEWIKIWNMSAFWIYKRILSKDKVWVLYWRNEIVIDLALYKKVRKMLNDSDLPEDEIFVSLYQIWGEQYMICILHREEPIFIIWAFTVPKQASLFDEQ